MKPGITLTLHRIHNTQKFFIRTKLSKWITTFRILTQRFIDIGDRKPSKFYRTLKQIAGTSDTLSDKLITQLWLRKLPTQIQVSLKTLPNPEIRTLLNMSDSIFEIIQSNNQGQIQSVSHMNEPHQNDYVTRLENQIKILTEAIQKLNTNTASTSSYRSRSRSRPRRNNDSGPNTICWYHQKFKENAKKCIPPCNFTKNS